MATAYEWWGIWILKWSIYIYIYIYIYSPERGGLVVGICELALRTLIRVRASTWEECGDLCWGAPDYQLSWSVRVRFVVISNHCSYGLIQYSLTGGAPMVTSRGRVTMVAPALFFIQQYIYIYINSQTLEKNSTRF